MVCSSPERLQGGRGMTEERMRQRPEPQGASCLKKTVLTLPGDTQRNNRESSEGCTFCLSVISEVFVVPALLVGVLLVQRKWLNPALATQTQLFQAAGMSHQQCLGYSETAGRKTELGPATTMKLWVVSQDLEHPWGYQEKAATWNVLPKELQSLSRIW